MAVVSWEKTLDLYSYYRRHGELGMRQLAERVDVPQPYLRQLAYRHRWPSRNLAIRLVDETDGELDLYSLMEDYHIEVTATDLEIEQAILRSLDMDDPDELLAEDIWRRARAKEKKRQTMLRKQYGLSN